MIFNNKLNLENIVIEGNQTTNLNSRQQNEARCYFSYLLNGREHHCGLNADYNKGCKKTVSELNTIWEAKQISKGKKICKCGWQQLTTLHGNKDGNIKPPKKCPECNGVRRVEPLLFINEKFGNGLHRFVDDVEEKYGNVCEYCKSCQMIWDRKLSQVDLPLRDKNNADYTTIKSVQVRPNFPNDLKNYLAKHTHACYQEVINTWTKKYKCAQKLLELSFNSWFDTPDGFDIIDINEYSNFKCDSKHCDSDHIVLKTDIINHKLVKIQSDFDSFNQIENDLQKIDNFNGDDMS